MKIIKKKPLIASGVAVAALAVGATIAYNQDSMFFNNLFHLATDEVVFTEEFVSPDDWVPCTETPKVAYATNKSETTRYARMKIDEYWRVANSQTSADDHTTSDLPLTWDDNGVTKKYAVINMQNTNEWIERDGWYYYTVPLEKNDTTDSLLESVTLNCDANLVGSISYSQDGLTGESVPSDYANASYHLYVTMELSDTEWENQRLYDTVAAKTKGVDTNIDFSKSSSLTSGNGNGVNTLAAHASDTHPVYYYRGDVDNFVIFNDHCWRIVRTTGTGGTKLIYSGEPDQNSSCPEKYVKDWAGSDVKYSGNGYQDDGMMYVGYMLDSSLHQSDVITEVAYNSNISYNYSETATWDGTNYNLGTLDTSGTSFSDLHLRYFCADGSTSCPTIYYAIETMSGSGYNFESIELSNGDLLDDKFDTIFSNEDDSVIKTAVDSWYTTNMNGVADKLEDTVFCNDRTYYTGNLAFDTNSGQPMSASIGRVAYTFTPSVDCPKVRDSFTVNSVNGNGKLDYKVGLLTADEVNLAGFPWGWSKGEGYLNEAVGQYQGFWTMTPSYIMHFSGIAKWRPNESGKGDLGFNDGNSYADSRNYYRPVVSLIYDTYVASGSGTAEKPYILEWNND